MWIEDWEKRISVLEEEIEQAEFIETKEVKPRDYVDEPKETPAFNESRPELELPPEESIEAWVEVREEDEYAPIPDPPENPYWEEPEPRELGERFEEVKDESSSLPVYEASPEEHWEEN